MSSIVLVEAHTLFAAALQRLLARQTDLEIVHIVESGEEALKKLPELKVDLTLVDVSLPNMSGIELVRQMRTEFPHLRCLILSGHMTQKYVERALKVGAHGYVLKDDVNGIVEGIRRALKGESYLSSALRRNGLEI
jgi:DNA-binding NarL/FixJ family response regulator